VTSGLYIPFATVIVTSPMRRTRGKPLRWSVGHRAARHYGKSRPVAGALTMDQRFIINICHDDIYRRRAASRVKANARWAGHGMSDAVA
jgi:hypothetical protein